MIVIRELKQSDMDFVRANPFEEAVKEYPNLIPAPDSWTCLFDGEIVGIGGIIELWKGVCEVWLMLTKQARKDGIFGLIAYHTIRAKMDELIQKYQPWRVQAHVRDDFPKAIKFIESLGFEYEGIMEKYLPDKGDLRVYRKFL